MTATQPSPRRAQREATGPVRRLVIVHGPDGVGRSLVLDEAPVTLGRAGHGDGPLARGQRRRIDHVAAIDRLDHGLRIGDA